MHWYKFVSVNLLAIIFVSIGVASINHETLSEPQERLVSSVDDQEMETASLQGCLCFRRAPTRIGFIGCVVAQQCRYQDYNNVYYCDGACTIR